MTLRHSLEPAHERLPVPDGSDILAMLDRYGIVVSLTAVYEWGVYRYSTARDAIAAAKRGSSAGGPA